MDERLRVVRDEYGLLDSDFWQLPQNKSTWLIKHSALEIVAAKAQIIFDQPTIVEAKSGEGVACICVTGHWKDRTVWSFGEANPKNSKTSYPWAIAEKRAIDRVILKLIGVHGLVYSEDEMAEPRHDPDTGEITDDRPAAPRASKALSRTEYAQFQTRIREANSKTDLTVLRDEMMESNMPADWYESICKDWDDRYTELRNAAVARQQKNPSALDSIEAQFGSSK